MGVLAWMPALLLATGTLQGTVPSHELADSLCVEALAPCTDVDSLYLWRQDAVSFPQPRIIKRQSVRGMEGLPFSFSYDCPGTCQYWVTASDTHGNVAACEPRIVQVGGTTSVPISGPLASAPERWLDILGRRADTTRTGIYRSTHGRWKRVLR